MSCLCAYSVHLNVTTFATQARRFFLLRSTVLCFRPRGEQLSQTQPSSTQWSRCPRSSPRITSIGGDAVLGAAEVAEGLAGAGLDASERVGDAGGDGRLVEVLGPEAERPACVGGRFGVVPRAIHDVALEMLRALMVRHFHQLLGGQLEEHRRK